MMSKESRLRQLQTRVKNFLGRDVWDTELVGLPTFRAIGVRSARIAYLAVRGLMKNECLNQASGLTYITVLSLVPTIALAASVAKGFGAWDHLLDTTVEPFLESFFGGDVEVPGEGEAEGAAAGDAANESEDPPETTGAESGESPVEIDDSIPAEEKIELRVAIEKILDFVEKTNFQRLGIFGLAFVLFTVIKLLTSIENVLNRIWGVDRPRSFVRKVTDYVALVVVTPILLITSTAATGALQSNAFVEYLSDDLRLGPVLTLGFKLLPLLSLWLGFGFLYMALPNTRVKVLSALIGGILGGTLWQVFQVLHVEFQVGVARYNEIYAGFAAFPIFLVWIYMSWVIVLLGAQLAWAHQAEPEYRELMRDVPSTVADREQLAVHAVVAIAR
ncbi:MAG: YihY/virulence factor BrkB family protein, partial [Planctomycetota bacterium JB042]